MGDYNERDKFVDKIKKDPMVGVGLTGFTGIVAYGLYNLKKRKMSLSLYLIQLRVIAQGTVIGSLTLGIAYTLGKSLYQKFGSNEKKSD